MCTDSVRIKFLLKNSIDSEFCMYIQATYLYRMYMYQGTHHPSLMTHPPPGMLFQMKRNVTVISTKQKKMSQFENKFSFGIKHIN